MLAKLSPITNLVIRRDATPILWVPLGIHRPREQKRNIGTTMPRQGERYRQRRPQEGTTRLHTMRPVSPTTEKAPAIKSSPGVSGDSWLMVLRGAKGEELDFRRRDSADVQGLRRSSREHP